MITHDINVLIGKDNPDKNIAVKRHDTGVNFRVYLKTVKRFSHWRKEETDYIIPHNVVAVLKIAKPDKTYVLIDGSVSPSSVLYEIPEDSKAFAVSGKNEAEVSLYGANGRRITSATFYIDVDEECACDCEQDSGSYVDILGKQIEEIKKAEERAVAAASHPPILSDNATWMEWDVEKEEYIDTGIKATDASDWDQNDPTSADYIRNKPAINGSIGENSIIKNDVDNIAGALAFRILQAVESESMYIVSDEDRIAGQLAAGDVFSVYFKNNYDLCGEITAIKTMGNGTARIDVDTFITEALVEDPTDMQNVFRVPAKPTVGYLQVADYSHAGGYNTKAVGFAAHAGGNNTMAAGKYSHTEGHSTEAAYAAHAEGKGTKAHGQTSHSEGYQTQAQASGSHAEGNKTTASGIASHSEGFETIASGDYSHSQGNTSKATGNSAHAEGYNTIASGVYSHAEGYSTKASGADSHAEGKGTEASGKYSHTEGNGTEAMGENSHAEGKGTKALGFQAHTEGNGTIASANTWNQHVQGKFNEPMGSEYAHVVGNGTADDARSNAYTLDWNGNAWFAGDVTVGASKKRLATEKYVNSKVGDIEAALDSIIAMQNRLIGGASV